MKRTAFARSLLLCALIPGMFFSWSALAGRSAPSSSEHAQATLLYAKGQDMLQAAVQLRLAPGWHTYWRTPGDSGLPVRFDWTGSGNLKADPAVSWPVPRRLKELDLTTFGYSEEVVFPLAIQPQEAGKPVHIALKLDILVCNNICVPQSLKLEADIPADGGSGDEGGILALAQAKMPATTESSDLKIETVVSGPDALAIVAFSKDGFDGAEILAEIIDDKGQAIALTATPEIKPEEGNPQKAVIRIAAPQGMADLKALLQGKTLRLTIAAGHKAIEKTISGL